MKNFRKNFELRDFEFRNYRIGEDFPITFVSEQMSEQIRNSKSRNPKFFIPTVSVRYPLTRLQTDLADPARPEH